MRPRHGLGSEQCSSYQCNVELCWCHQVFFYMATSILAGSRSSHQNTQGLEIEPALLKFICCCDSFAAISRMIFSVCTHILAKRTRNKEKTYIRLCGSGKLSGLSPRILRNSNMLLFVTRMWPSHSWFQTVCCANQMYVSMSLLLWFSVLASPTACVSVLPGGTCGKKTIQDWLIGGLSVPSKSIHTKSMQWRLEWQQQNHSWQVVLSLHISS